ncbi:MAG: UDP-2,3-diacylglucosamine diphosphatase [Phycisphaeraceae bacterium]
MKLQYKSVWISDTHLGSKGARAKELARFLKQVRCDRLYLVGDILDCWRLKARWYWPAEHNDVVRRILKHASRGTEVVYVPGNHDDAARQFVHMAFGGVEVKPHTTHTTADGKKLFVTHGDQYDLVVQHSKLLAVFGSIAYETLLKINRHYNVVRRWLGLPYASLSQAIKLKVKRACTFISKFEEILAHEAHKRGMDGVVCGHIHKAEQRTMEHGVEYLNCGDWVESCTALVEHADGRLEIVDGIKVVEELKAKRDADRLINKVDRVEDEELDLDDELPELLADDRALFGAFRPIFLGPGDESGGRGGACDPPEQTEVDKPEPVRSGGSPSLDPGHPAASNRKGLRR